MSKHLPVPPELEHLIEKRDEETDRRQRSGGASGVGTNGADAEDRAPRKRSTRTPRQKALTLS